MPLKQESNNDQGPAAGEPRGLQDRALTRRTPTPQPLPPPEIPRLNSTPAAAFPFPFMRRAPSFRLSVNRSRAAVNVSLTNALLPITAPSVKYPALNWDAKDGGGPGISKFRPDGLSPTPGSRRKSALKSTTAATARPSRKGAADRLQRGTLTHLQAPVCDARAGCRGLRRGRPRPRPCSPRGHRCARWNGRRR